MGRELSKTQTFFFILLAIFAVLNSIIINFAIINSFLYHYYRARAVVLGNRSVASGYYAQYTSNFTEWDYCAPGNGSTFIGWTKEGAYMEATGRITTPTTEATYWIEHDFPDCSTNQLTNFSALYNLQYSDSGMFDNGNLTIAVYAGYSTGDVLIHLYMATTAESGWHSITFDFPADLTFDRLKIMLLLRTATGIALALGILSWDFEFYRGCVPSSEDLTPDHAKTGTPTLFAQEFDTEVSATYLSLCYTKYGTIKSFLLEPTWVSPYYYSKSLTFNATGFYSAQYTTYYGFFNTSMNEIWILYVSDLYPASAYLSLFSQLDGFPLEGKDFKIYLGTDEEVSLVDFRTFYGNWSKVYASDVNASLIDNYLEFSALQNGLKTDFEGGENYNTQIYNTICFQAKALNATELIVVYNPRLYEKDYHLDFYENMTGIWYDISIPFHLFNQYQNATNEFIYEVAFLLKNSTIQISNIRIAAHYNLTWISQAQLNITSESENAWIRSDLSPLSKIELNDTDLVFYNENNTQNWENDTAFTGGTLTFTNNTGGVLALNSTGHLLGNQSFTNDAIDANPAGWTVTEPADTDVRIVTDIGGHKKVCRLFDNSGSYPKIVYSFSSRATGYLAVFLRFTTTGQGTYFDLWQSTTKLPIRLHFENDGSIHTSVAGVSTDIGATYTANDWFRLEIEWNATKHRIAVNSTDYGWWGNHDPTGTPDNLQVITHVWASATDYFYLDSLDFNWTSGFYFNRYTECQNGSYNSTFVNSPLILQQALSAAANNSQSYTLEIRNQTGTWLTYANDSQLLDEGEWRLNLTSSDGLHSAEIDAIMFNTSIPKSVNVSFAYDWLNKSQFVDALIQVRIRCNETGLDSNVSIFNLTSAAFQNQTVITSSFQTLEFRNASTEFYADSRYFLLNICSFGLVPHEIIIDWINITFSYYRLDQNATYDISVQNYTTFQAFYGFYKFSNDDGYYELSNSTEFFNKTTITNDSNWHRLSLTLNYTNFTLIRFTFVENNTLWNQNFTAYLRECAILQNSTYRLISPENRQNPNSLTFDTETQTLAILDYFNNILYRDEWNYTPFVDIGLPIVTLTFENNELTPRLVTIVRGLGTEIEIVIPSESAISLRIFATSYRVEVRNLELQLLEIIDFSPNSAGVSTIRFGERKSISIDYPTWVWLIWLTVGLIAIIIVLELGLYIASYVNRRKKTNVKLYQKSPKKGPSTM